MKKLHIYALMPFSWEVERLKFEAEQLGCEVILIDYFSKGIKDLPDFVIFRGVFDHGLGLDAHLEQARIAENLRKTNALILNDQVLQIQPFDKQVQQILAAKYKLPGIETRAYHSTKEMEEDTSWRIWPRVGKPNQGSCGNGVVLLESMEQTKELFAIHKIDKYVFQEVMERGRDIRVMVVGDTILGGMLRVAAPKVFVSNYSQGGKVDKFPIDSELKDLVQKIVRAFHLEYAGIDLIRDQKGRWRLLEINRGAQFRGFEMSTGVNVAKSLIIYMLNQKSTSRRDNVV